MQTNIDPEKTFDKRLGVEHGEVSPERTSATMTVHDGVLTEDGVVHGGVWASIAEGLASIGTFVGVAQDGFSASGLSNDTRTLAEVRSGKVEVVARRRDQKPDLWTWVVEATTEDGTLCAFSTVLIAVRPMRQS